MSDDITHTWIVCRLAPDDGCDLRYAVLCLTPGFRAELANALKGWAAAETAMSTEGFEISLYDNAIVWLDRDPSDWDESQSWDSYEWVSPPRDLLEELACTPEELVSSKEQVFQEAAARTDSERMTVRGGVRNRVYFTAYEKHGSQETSTGSLPDWVLSWATSDNADNNADNNTEVQDEE